MGKKKYPKSKFGESSGLTCPMPTKCSKKEIVAYFTALRDWLLVKQHHLSKTFVFQDCQQALAFVMKVTKIGASENHFPSIFLRKEKVQINIWTQHLDGLTLDDFIVAGTIDKIF